MRLGKEQKSAKQNNSDIPILLIGFNRPHLIAKRLNELSAIPNLTLIISIDGGADKEVEIEMNHILETLDRYKMNHSDVQIIRHNSNLGLAEHITTSITNLLEKFKSLIIIEDDIAVSENFYNNMVNGISAIQNRNNIATVGGYSAVGIFSIFKIHNKFRVTKYFSPWGWAITDEIWRLYRLDIGHGSLEQQLDNSSSWNSLSKKQKIYWMNLFKKVEKNPKLTWDIQMQFMCFKYELRNFLPLKSLITNEGFGDSTSTNHKDNKPWWMSRKRNNELIYSTTGKILGYIYEELLDPIFMSSDKTNVFIVILAKRFSKAARTLLKHLPL